MIKNISLRLPPETAFQNNALTREICKNLNTNNITHFNIIHRSIDARQRNIFINLNINVYIDEQPQQEPYHLDYQDVTNKEQVIIVGAGPAGLFAALHLIELGLCPIIIERGKDVHQRKVDLANLNRYATLNPDSNYAFGEGGAGTFSDGKLYTRSVKRGNVNKILHVFHHHGASDDILIDAHPHIGTDKLPHIIENIRNTIINCGGRVLFNYRLTNLDIKDNKISSITINNKEKIEVKNLILATGHSARDVYQLLKNRGIALEEKSFAMGIRVEHPQELIDQIQYHNPNGRGKYLPPATYSYVTQVNNRGVYSFCMCPGGFIVPAMTNDKEIVVNGMSPSRRNSPFANSGIVVEIHPEDVNNDTLAFQQSFEHLAYLNGNHLQAPAQRLTDFVSGRLSSSLPKTSYIPSIVSSPLHSWMPEIISSKLRKGFEIFGSKSRGFLTNEAIIVGVESRTSSPIRIPRNRDTFSHIHITNLYPCGEGSGYSGGIVSSAIDGELCAEKIANKSTS